MLPYNGTCLIDSVGINSNDGRVHFFLKAADGAFDWTPFIAKQDHNREILAIALAAITSSKNVVIQTNDIAAYTEVWWFDIVK